MPESWNVRQTAKSLTDEVAPPPVRLIRAGMGILPSSILFRSERAGRRFIEFFTNIRNRNTR